MTKAQEKKLRAEIDRLGSIEFGSEQFWREWHVHGYAGIIHHIVQMAHQNHITTRKATEMIEWTVRYAGKARMPEPPPAPWKEYLSDDEVDNSQERKESV